MRIAVTGHAPLTGTYQPAGNANAAQSLLAASLLTEELVTLRNLPATRSTQALLDAIQQLGAIVTPDGETTGTITIDASQLTRRPLKQTEHDATLGVILLAAPLIARRTHARLEIDFPLNRIRTHLEALRDLGISVTTREGSVEFVGKRWDTHTLVLTQTSVTATALIMMLAARLGKHTTIHNAAGEPHIQSLAGSLVQMGARIEGVGSNIVQVWGTEALHGADVTIPSDHIEAASVGALAALTGGRLTVTGCGGHDLRMIAKVYAGLGITCELEPDALHIPRHEELIISNREEDIDAAIETAPWPGFPSDLVAIATLIASQSQGTALIHEKLYNNRLLFVDKLKAMGAQIVLCDPHRAIVVGSTPLRSIYMDSPDVRTGLGMIGAALVAEGTSIIDNAQALDHSFAGILTRLRTINAQITVE